MKKITSLIALALFMIGSAFSQMIIDASLFAENPSRYNGKRVTIKNIVIDLNFKDTFKGVKVGTTPKPTFGGSALGIPNLGPLPTGNSTVVMQCNPPRGFERVVVLFPQKPEYIGCFFMADAMKKKLISEAGGQTKLDAEVTIKGDSNTGYNITFFRVL